MKALTLTEPWATLMMLGEKNYETRSWSTKYRGLIAIHAAKGYPKYAKEFTEEPEVVAALSRHNVKPSFPLGHILCVRELITVHRTEDLRDLVSSNEYCFGDYSDGRFAWIFSPRIKIFQPPISAKGALGLWDWIEVKPIIKGP